MTKIDFRAAFDAIASPHMVLDRTLRFVAANPAYIAAVGRPYSDLDGQLLFDMFPNDGDSGRKLRASLNRVLATGQPDTLAYLPYAIPVAGGGMETRYWTAVHTPVLDASGRTAFVVQNTVDVTGIAALRTDTASDWLPFKSVPGEAALLERAVEAEQRQERAMVEAANFRRLFQQAPGLIVVLNGPDHVFSFANDASNQFFGGRELLGRPLREALPEITGQGFVELLDEVYRTGQPRRGASNRMILQDSPSAPQRETFIDFTFTPIFDDDGATTGIIAQGADRTSDVVAQQRQRMLLDELNHRVKNTLATVQSIAKQTLRANRDPDSARSSFENRIMALSHAHDLLSRSNWDGADLQAIADREFAPFGPERFRIRGPSVHLAPRQALALGMVLHELTSNAARYGALSAPTGQVEFNWQLDTPDGKTEPWLNISWRETGGPIVSEPRHKGFGSRLIGLSVGGELSGRAELSYDPAGLRCQMSIPHNVHNRITEHA